MVLRSIFHNTILFRCALPTNLPRFPAPSLPTYSLVAISVFFRGMSSIEYPQTRREDLVEDLHGVPVADPYRWLEDPKSPETTVPHLIHLI